MASFSHMCILIHMCVDLTCAHSRTSTLVHMCVASLFIHVYSHACVASLLTCVYSRTALCTLSPRRAVCLGQSWAGLCGSEHHLWPYHTAWLAHSDLGSELVFHESSRSSTGILCFGIHGASHRSAPMETAHPPLTLERGYGAQPSAGG